MRPGSWSRSISRVAVEPALLATGISCLDHILDQVARHGMIDLTVGTEGDLHSWFQEFDAEAWDQQFETDVKAGRLDALAEQALRDLREGRCTDL